MKATAAATKTEPPTVPPVAPIEQVVTVRPSFWKRNRSRLTKSALGVSVLGFGLYHAYSALFVYESSTATVTSTLSTLSSPISGVVRHSLTGPGARIEHGFQVAQIDNPRIDRTHIARLRAQLLALDGEIASLTDRRLGYSTLGMKFESRGRKYLEHRREQLAFEVSQATANVDSARALEAAARAELMRQMSLRKEGVSSEQALEAATSAHAVAEQARLVAEKEKESKVAAIDGTRAGFTLDSSSPTDRTYSGQRADDVELRLAELDALASEKLVQRRAVQAELDEALVQLELMSQVMLRAPGVHRVWDVLVADGEFVYAGRPILNWLECNKIHVVAYVSAEVFERLQLGTRASIRFPHRKGDYEGTISLLPGQNEHSERSKQALLGKGAVGMGHAVLVASSALASALSATCEVGQAVEVRFFP